MKLAARAAVLLAVAAVVPACGGSSGGGEPAPMGGGLQILSRGGTGTTGAGGKGGEFRILASIASDIQILSSGTVNTAVNVPLFKPNLGDNPRTITGNVVVTPAAGVVNSSIPGDNAANPATGLHITPGATLTLRPHIDGDDADTDANSATGTFEWVDVAFPKGAYIEGTLRIGRKDSLTQGDGASPNTADSWFTPESLVVTSTGRIDGSGVDAPGSTGGNGGFINSLVPGAIVNAGTIDTSGGDGNTGGAGAFLYLAADYGWYSTGVTLSSGGAASAGVGGTAGYQYIFGSNDTFGGLHGGAFNTGVMLARGGDGTTTGGDGNFISISGSAEGATLNSGTIDTSGGSATLSGNGGDAGRIVLDGYSGSIRAAGTLTARGGSGIGLGGSGGEVMFQLTPSEFVVNQPVMGGMFIGAAIDACGGAGATGGAGGNVEVYSNSAKGRTPGSDPVMLVGYGTIDNSGGDGASGADGGGGMLSHTGSADDNGNITAGSIINEASWVSRGGDGSSGAGGGGVSLDFRIYPGAAALNVPAYDRSVTNRGSLDTSGGNGSTTGGWGGDVYMYDYFRVVNEGRITTSGGTGGVGVGGSAGDVALESDDVLTITASITVDGGTSGAGTGGDGRGIQLRSRATTVVGGLYARGGSSGTGTGGNGGTMEIFSTENGTIKSGTFSVAGGSGPAAGTAGSIVIDGIKVALTDGSIGF